MHESKCAITSIPGEVFSSERSTWQASEVSIFSVGTLVEMLSLHC